MTWVGVGLALIGLPGLGLVILARHLGINAELQASGLADIWYRYPVLVLEGIQNGVLAPALQSRRRGPDLLPVLSRIPWLRRIPPRLMVYGARTEHLQVS